MNTITITRTFEDECSNVVRSWDKAFLATWTVWVRHEDVPAARRKLIKTVKYFVEKHPYAVWGELDEFVAYDGDIILSISVENSMKY